MTTTVAYEDAVDLLDTDHKAVKKKFIDYDAMCEDGVPADARRALAGQICDALLVHMQIEEEIFYPAVGEATGDDALMDRAAEEHAQAKEVIATIRGLDAQASELDATVKSLAKLIDAHVLEEREQIFLEARHSTLDLRSLAVTLYERKAALKSAGTKKHVRAAKTGRTTKDKK